MNLQFQRGKLFHVPIGGTMPSVQQMNADK